MPTYEYQCEKCGKAFEVFQNITEDPVESCPQKGCGGRVKRLMGAGAGLIFKGSGFYATDYKGNGSSKGGAAPKCPAAESGECSSGACPAAKSDD